MSNRVLALAMVLTASAAGAAAGERLLVDRIVASVNGQAILASEWDEAVRYEAFLESRPLDTVTEQDRQAALQRLIDQKLLTQQIVEGEFVGASGEEVWQQVGEVRKQHPAGGSDAEWQAALARYGLTEDQFAARLGSSVDALHFIELRLRPSVHIEREEVEDYYREKLVPEMERNGRQPEPLAQVVSRIEELLVQERMNEMFDSWLRNLREQSEIRIR